jgi:hypothetical protein
VIQREQESEVAAEELPAESGVNTTPANAARTVRDFFTATPQIREKESTVRDRLD